MKKAALFIAFCLSVIAAKAQPVFKGGAFELNRFLSSKIIYPEYSRQNCIGGTVQVSFMLDKTGNVNGARIQQGTGIDLDDEALRVIRLTSGKWIIPDDYDTGTRIVLPVKFTPDAQRCHGVYGQAKAIEAYKDRQELEKIVTTYYKNKYQGKADTTAESKIIQLKKQLNINDELISDILDQAKAKQKQGDITGACTDWQFIRNTGSSRADKFIAKYCR